MGVSARTCPVQAMVVLVVIRSDGDHVDLHPVTFDVGGTGWQANADMAALAAAYGVVLPDPY
jgi:hypothetical protein